MPQPPQFARLLGVQVPLQQNPGCSKPSCRNWQGWLSRSKGQMGKTQGGPLAEGTNGGGHSRYPPSAVVHCLSTHISPAGHATPKPPQFWGSDVVPKQDPETQTPYPPST